MPSNNHESRLNIRLASETVFARISREIRSRPFVFVKLYSCSRMAASGCSLQMQNEYEASMWNPLVLLPEERADLCNSMRKLPW